MLPVIRVANFITTTIATTIMSNSICAAFHLTQGYRAQWTRTRVIGPDSTGGTDISGKTNVINNTAIIIFNTNSTQIGR